MNLPPVPSFLLAKKQQVLPTTVNTNVPSTRANATPIVKQRNLVQPVNKSLGKPSTTDQVFPMKYESGELQIIISSQQTNKPCFFVTNRSFFELSVQMTITVNNMNVVSEQEQHRLNIVRESSNVFKVSFVVGANVNERIVLCHLVPVTMLKQFTYSFTFNVTVGDHTVQPDPYHYGIPLVASDTIKRILVGQGFHGTFSHQGLLKHCIDFIIPQGTPIVAARDGMVCKVVQHFTEHGKDSSFADKANVIMILHSDGTMSNYSHLIPNGARVRVGQSVNRGQVIGLSGNTGWSTQPHLHFHVCSVDRNGHFVSVPYVFDNGTSNGFVPTQGEHVLLSS
jgi:hypothetical protein